MKLCEDYATEISQCNLNSVYYDSNIIQMPYANISIGEERFPKYCKKVEFEYDSPTGNLTNFSDFIIMLDRFFK